MGVERRACLATLCKVIAIRARVEWGWSGHGRPSAAQGESSAVIRGRGLVGRKRRLARYAREGFYSNALMKPRHVKKHGELDAAGGNLLAGAMQRFGLRARAYHRILDVARPVADLEGRENNAPHHLEIAYAVEPSGRRRVMII
jgi:magnesium chelatase family protein